MFTLYRNVTAYRWCGRFFVWCEVGEIAQRRHPVAGDGTSPETRTGPTTSFNTRDAGDTALTSPSLQNLSLGTLPWVPAYAGMTVWVRGVSASAEYAGEMLCAAFPPYISSRYGLKGKRSAWRKTTLKYFISTSTRAARAIPTSRLERYSCKKAQRARYRRSSTRRHSRINSVHKRKSIGAKWNVPDCARS